MSVTLPAPRPELRELQPYVGGESRLPGIARPIKLASNESALGPSPTAVAAVRDAAATLHRYPDGACQALRTALAGHYGLDAARIVCGAGSDELITLLARAYAGPGDEVLYTEHGFLMYPIAAVAVGARAIAAPEAALTADPDALLALVGPGTRIVFLANPNNPTGTYLSTDALRDLRRRLPDNVLLVLDVAYAEYVDAGDYGPCWELVDAHDNVVVTRTFSKIYGLGGLRLGWAYAPTAIADVLNRLRNPFSVSSAAQAAGIAALEDKEFVERARDHNRVWRAWTTDKLRTLGLSVGDSHANFVLVRFPVEPGADAAAADAFLKQRGIIARRMNSYRLPDSLRLSIGLEAEMRAAVDALADFVNGTPR
jgi:histidinol-phosphate aminotransferase